MGRKRIFEDPSIDPTHLDRNNWPTVLVDNLEDSLRDIYFKRKQAVDLYFDGKLSIKEISSQTNITRQQLNRLIKNCLEFDLQGEIYGYRALIPYKRIKSYERKATVNGFKDTGEPVKLAGAFTNLLNTHPDLKELIHNYFLNRSKREINEPVARVKYLHRKFIILCKAQGIDPIKGDYPFNTEDLGKRALYRYVKQLEAENSKIISDKYGKDASTLLNNTGLGNQASYNDRPFKRVEFDGHKIDAIFAIEYETPEGDVIVDTLSRIWILTIIDTATRVVLGYHLCLSKEYSAQDVLMCIRNAIIPWKPMEFTINNLKYPSEGGFVSYLIPETQYAVWDEIAFDNAKANLANKVKEKLKKTIGCSVNTGPVGTPTRRPIIEKFFDILEENGFHRLPNTTGSNPHDPRRKDPEKAAIDYKMTVDEIKEVVEVLIAARNGTPQSGTNYLSPIEVMKQRVITKSMLPRLLPLEIREDINLLSLNVEVTVQGNMKLGRRPFIHYMGVDYRSELLSNSWKLIKSKLKIIVNTEDLRSVQAFLPSGEELGVLRAKGKWGLKKHSLAVRKQINKLKRRGFIHFTNQDDPIEIYFEHLRSKSKNNKNARNSLLLLEVEQEETSINTSSEENMPLILEIENDSILENTTGIETKIEETNIVDDVIHLSKQKRRKSINHNSRRTFNS